MADEIHLDAGDHAEDVIAGKGNLQQRPQQRSDPQQNMYIGNSDNREITQLWLKYYELGQLIREHTSQINSSDNRITKLENLEVEVGRDSVRIRQAPEAANLSVRALTNILILGVLIAVIVAGLLVYWNYRYG